MARIITKKRQPIAGNYCLSSLSKMVTASRVCMQACFRVNWFSGVICFTNDLLNEFSKRQASLQTEIGSFVVRIRFPL